MVYIQGTFYPARRKYSRNNLIAKKKRWSTHCHQVLQTACCKTRNVPLLYNSLPFFDVLQCTRNNPTHTHTHTHGYIRETLYMNFFVERCQSEKCQIAITRTE